MTGDGSAAGYLSSRNCFDTCCDLTPTLNPKPLNNKPYNPLNPKPKPRSPKPLVYAAGLNSLGNHGFLNKDW